MTKGDKTKEMILDVSEKLFASAGYAVVTMNDVCGATGLSRGGLYRHFSSVKEIFIGILIRDVEVNSYTVDEVIGRGVPADRIFRRFLSIERDSMLSPDRGFFFAVHEFAFLEADQRDFFEIRVKKSTSILERIFIYGQKTGVFRNFNARILSIHVLHLLDSMKTSSSVLRMDEKQINEQFNIIWELIL